MLSGEKVYRRCQILNQCQKPSSTSKAKTKTKSLFVNQLSV
jgi:hypothetical protein